MKKHNFNAGPSILPREVIEKTAQAILDFNGSGLSLMEISHRAKDFQPVVDEAVALFKELLNIPEGYSVLFLGGGASMEFEMLSGAMEKVAEQDIAPDTKILRLIETHLDSIKMVVFRNGTLRAGFFRDIWRVEAVRKNLSFNDFSM